MIKDEIRKKAQKPRSEASRPKFLKSREIIPKIMGLSERYTFMQDADKKDPASAIKNHTELQVVTEHSMRTKEPEKLLSA